MIFHNPFFLKKKAAIATCKEQSKLSGIECTIDNVLHVITYRLVFVTYMYVSCANEALSGVISIHDIYPVGKNYRDMGYLGGK